jgi:hypothetical protein
MDMKALRRQARDVQEEIETIMGGESLIATPNATLTKFEEQITTPRVAEAPAEA